MFCNSCGAELEPGVKFCPACGAKTEAAQEQTQEPVTVNEDFSKTDAKKKKTVVTLAVIACVLTVITAILNFFSGYFGSSAGAYPEPYYFTTYLANDFAYVLTDVIAPVIIAVLFIVFCNLIDVRSNTRKALTGVPMVLTFIDGVIAFTVTCVVIARNAVTYGSAEVFLLNIGYLIRTSFLLASTALFVLFYILGAANTFAKPLTGKVLAVVLGVWVELISFISMFSEIINAAIQPQELFGVYKLLAIPASITSFSAGLITVIAMIICAFWFSSRAEMSASVNGEDTPSAGYAILGFLIPLVGLILYLSAKDKTPLKARSAGRGALAGVAVSLVFYILISVVLIIFSFKL